MAKGFYSQGVVILFSEEPALSSIAALLSNFRIVKEAQKTSGWEYGGASLIVEYDAAVNGYASIDVVGRAWPDHMGDPKSEPKLFAAWSMGSFGPYAYPGGLQRAVQQSWVWEKARDVIPSNKSFVRLRMSYVFGTGDDAPVMPQNYDPLKELDFLTAMVARVLAHPAAICYFNPNGEVVLTKELFGDSAEYHKAHALPPFDLWSNVRLFNIDPEWCLMDSVGSCQLDIPDHEVAFPKGRFQPQEVDKFIRNATLYVLKNGPVIKDGDTMDGPGDIRWQAKTFKNGLNDPPRQTLRWLPTGFLKVPPILLSDRPVGRVLGSDGDSRRWSRKYSLLLLAIVVCLVVGLAAVIISGGGPGSTKKTGSTQWVDPSKLTPGPIRRDQLSVEQTKRIAAIRGLLGAVDSSPQEKWEDDFRRDADPDRELATWEAMAKAYARYTANKNWPIDKRKELFAVLLVGSGAPPDEALAHMKLKIVSEAEAREALGILAEEWRKQAKLEAPRP